MVYIISIMVESKLSLIHGGDLCEMIHDRIKIDIIN